MTLDHCLNNAVAGGALSKDDAATIKQIYDGFSARHRRAGRSDAEAASLAQAETSARLRAEAREGERQARLMAAKSMEVDGNLERFRTAAGKKNVTEAAIAHLEHYQTAPFSSVEGKRKAIIGRAHAMLGDMLQSFERTRFLGRTPEPALLDNVVREAFGQATGDERAAALAKAWGDTAEWLRSRFNQAGGTIGKLEHWGLPQNHDRLALMRGGRDKWKAFIRPLLDESRMVEPLTGQQRLGDEIDAMLDHIYDSITTGGWSKKEPGKVPAGKGALWKQRAENRYLIFRDADAWMAYQKEFGEANAFAAMMNHVNGMARDIAAMEVLGPNPNAMVEYLAQVVEKQAALKGARGESTGLAKFNASALRNMWAEMRGAANAPEIEGLGYGMATARNLITSAVMGSAILSAVPTDPIYQAISRRFAGLPAMNTFRDMALAFKGSMRHEAVRAGVILDSAMHVLDVQARYVGTIEGSMGAGRWLADRTLTFSFLTPWTQAARHAFAFGFMGHLADSVGKTFDQLNPKLRQVMEDSGLTAADWDVMRSAPLHTVEKEGVTFLRPSDVAGIDEAVGERFLEMILQGTEYAVPSGTIRGRQAFMTGLGSKNAGTLWGELARSAAMFKSFGLSFAFLHGQRTWRELSRSGAYAGAAYAGPLLITMTLGGALGLWLKDVAAGRDPRPIFDDEGNPSKFMRAAFLQGGGVGIFGDFLFADLNRYGGGLATTLGGPVVERGTQLLNLTIGNAAQLASGEDTRFLEDLRQFASRNVPGSSLWYLRLGYERVLMDQLEYLTDPKANAQFKRRQTNWLKQYGAEYWWKPGQAAPSRGPQMQMQAAPGG